MFLFFIFCFTGGREVYSQSKARSARHKNRQRHSGEFHPPSSSQQPQQQPPQPRGQDEVVTNSYQQQTGCKVLRETVFSSEIHSIEYNSPMASMSSGSSSADSPKLRHNIDGSAPTSASEAKISNRQNKMLSCLISMADRKDTSVQFDPI